MSDCCNIQLREGRMDVAREVVKAVYGNWYDHPPYTDLALMIADDPSGGVKSAMEERDLKRDHPRDRDSRQESPLTDVTDTRIELWLAKSPHDVDAWTSAERDAYRMAREIHAFRLVRARRLAAYNHTREDSPLTPCPECERSEKSTSKPVESPAIAALMERRRAIEVRWEIDRAATILLDEAIEAVRVAEKAGGK